MTDCPEVPSLFVATITGTAAREAAIIGKKALIFGDSWFNNCPNVFSWNQELTFQEIINEKIYDNNSIKNYLKNLMEQFSIPGCQNPSSENIFKGYLDDQFKKVEFEGIYKLMEKFIND